MYRLELRRTSQLQRYLVDNDYATSHMTEPLLIGALKTEACSFITMLYHRRKSFLVTRIRTTYGSDSCKQDVVITVHLRSYKTLLLSF
jgi:hypothetical protein